MLAEVCYRNDPPHLNFLLHSVKHCGEQKLQNVAGLCGLQCHLLVLLYNPPVTTEISECYSEAALGN